MKRILSESDKSYLETRIAEAEKKTRAQIVLATARRCDNYSEIPWKAFAFGASVVALIVFLADLLFPVWETSTLTLLSIVAILAAGIIPALLTVTCERFARLFLLRSRKHQETLQYAESLFLSRELFVTEGRRGILILISRFEKQVVILRDSGVRERLSTDVIKTIISKMTLALKEKEFRKAFETGLDELIVLLQPPLEGKGEHNELSDEIIGE